MIVKVASVRPLDVETRC